MKQYSKPLTLIEVVISRANSLFSFSGFSRKTRQPCHTLCSLMRGAKAASSSSLPLDYPPDAFVGFLTQGRSFLRQRLLMCGEFLAVTFSWEIIGPAEKFGESLIIVSNTGTAPQLRKKHSELKL